MNSDELFSSRGNVADSRFSSIPTRLHNSYSSFKTPHFVNNGTLDLSATNKHNLEDDTHSCINIGAELGMPRKTLNLHAVNFLPNFSNVTSYSTNWLNQHGSRKSQVYLADSGYSSKTYPQSVEAVQTGALSSRNGENMYCGPAGYSACSDHELSSWGNSLNSSTFHEQSLKSPLIESDTKRMMLLGKLREAHLTIQGLQKEVDSLTMEKKTLAFFKSESLKNREEFLMRVDDLDNALKVLTATHNALQSEAQKKEAVLEKTTFYVTTLEQNNNKLQEVNSGLRKELCSLRNFVDQQTSLKSDINKQLEQLNKDYQKILQDQAVLKHQLSESLKATEKAKSKWDKLNQEIVQLRMERDIQCGKVIVLEEEILHQQQSFNNLVREHECLLKDKAEQDQRLQREMHERLCLKMVNDLLKEESAHVKEAFQKLEEFTSSMEQKSKDMCLDLDRCKQGNLSGGTEEDKLKELSSSITESHQRGGIHFLQEEVCKIKESVTRLESEKTALICQVSKLHKEQDVLALQSSELEMTQAELIAENTQLRSELTTKSQKWAEELIQLRKDYADLAAKTSTRNQMICTLRDELMQRCQEIIELEAAFSSAKQQKLNTMAMSPVKRRRSDSDINKCHWQSCGSTGNSHKECNEIKKLTAINAHLIQRLKELMAERDSALQDSQDLLNGMQQLREAFEEEMERELERERTFFEREKHLLQNAKSVADDGQLSGGNSKLETKVTLLTAEKIALEVKSKHLECERDELRNQVEELCKMRMAAEEKSVQVDPASSPRKRENKTTSRKRSKSVGMMSPSVTGKEMPDRPV